MADDDDDVNDDNGDDTNGKYLNTFIRKVTSSMKLEVLAPKSFCLEILKVAIARMRENSFATAGRKESELKG